MRLRLEEVAFGAGREMCCAFLNIDLTAVGIWAALNNVAYGSYQELAGHPRVPEMIGSRATKVNESLTDDEMLSGCQIQRFLVLHKELDACDGELTHTRKVRRRIIEEKFGDLIAALHGGASKVSTTMEVTCEGRPQGIDFGDAGDSRGQGAACRRKGRCGMNLAGPVQLPAALAPCRPFLHTWRVTE